jgi:hypothetical protein
MIVSIKLHFVTAKMKLAILAAAALVLHSFGQVGNHQRLFKRTA